MQYFINDTNTITSFTVKYLNDFFIIILHPVHCEYFLTRLQEFLFNIYLIM